MWYCAKTPKGWTEAKIARYVKEGRGQGELSTYKPWLTIQDVPSSGRVHRVMGWKTEREHHFLSDMRWCIMLILLFVFGKSRVSFKLAQRQYSMQVIQSFLLIGFFIWLGENIATFLGAWKYPDQLQTWQMVHLGKISSWYLLVIISIIIIVNLKYLRHGDTNKTFKLQNWNWVGWVLWLIK